MVFRSSKNLIPRRNPTDAGIHAVVFSCYAISIAGIRSDHTDAAIITPDANPSNSFCTFSFISFRIKNTIAEPNVVPANGIKIPAKIIRFIFSFSLH